MTTYVLTAPSTPGASPVVQARGTLRGLRAAARRFSSRRDLSRQDVRIERLDGSTVEFVGPCR